MLLSCLVGLVLFCPPASAQESLRVESDKDFHETFRSAILGYFEGLPSNPAAQEAFRFLQGNSEVRFERDTPEKRAVGRAHAIYVLNRKTIIVSFQALMASGIDPRRSRLDPGIASYAVGRIAETLVHELKHAQIHHELGWHPTVLENELLAYAAGAQYVANQPSLATPENYENGLRVLREYNPLFLKRMRLLREREDTGSAYLLAEQKKATAAAAKLERKFVLLGQEIKDIERAIASKEDELANAFRLPHETYMGLMNWAAYCLGWREFLEAQSFLNNLSVNSTDAEIKAHLEKIRLRVKALQGSEELTRERIEAAEQDAAFWNSSERRAGIQRYYSDRIKEAERQSGQGFKPAPVPAGRDSRVETKLGDDVSRRGVIMQLSAILALGMAAVAAIWMLIRRRRAAALKAEIVAFIQKHQAEHGIDAVRESLLGEGYKKDIVEAAIQAVKKSGQ